MSRPETPRSPRRDSAAEAARHAIESAEQDGADRTAMVLRLTLRDASEIKRDPKVATGDIRFVDGVMMFLGVRVAQGGVTVSRLDRDGADSEDAAPIDPPAAPKKKPRKKAVTAV